MISAMENFEKELICPVCDDYFTTPIVLPCHHNICHRCARDCLSSVDKLSNAGSVESVYSVSGSPPSSAPNSPPRTPTTRGSPPRFNGASTSPPVTRRKPLSRNGSLRNRSGSFKRQSTSVSESDFGGASTNKGLRRRESFSGRFPRPSMSTSSRILATKVKTFPCPSCKADVELGDKGLNGLFRNFTLEAIVERYKLAAKKAASIPCGSCRASPLEDATKSCLDCRASFCNVCYKNAHPWGTPRAQHVHVGPTRNYRPKTITCPEHQDERVTMYCDGCQKPICHMCKFSGIHSNHKVSGMDRKYNVMKDKLEKNIHKVKGRREAIETQLEKIKMLRAKLEESGVDFKQEVNSALGCVRTLLDNKEGSIVDMAESLISTRIGLVQSQLEEYEKMLSDCNVVEYAQEILKETEHACFVQAARPVISRMLKMSDASKVISLTVIDDHFDNYTVLPMRAAQAINNLDFLQAPGTPTMDITKSHAYNDVSVSWNPPLCGGCVDTYNLEYRLVIQSKPATSPRKNMNGESHDDSDRTRTETDWKRMQGIDTTSFTLKDLRNGTEYEFRVQAVNCAGVGCFSDVMRMKTTPASVFSFRFDAARINCGRDSVKITDNGMTATVCPNSHLLDNPGLVPTAPIALNPIHIIGDQKIASGKHYWEILINQSAYITQVGVISEKKSRTLLHQGDQVSTDSGHDSCEEAEVHDEPFGSEAGVISHVMGQIRLPPKVNNSLGNETPAITISNSIGILVDCENGLVTFYDGETKRVVYTNEQCVRGPVYPGLVIVGAGSFTIRSEC